MLGTPARHAYKTETVECLLVHAPPLHLFQAATPKDKTAIGLVQHPSDEEPIPETQTPQRESDSSYYPSSDCTSDSDFHSR